MMRSSSVQRLLLSLLLLTSLAAAPATKPVPRDLTGTDLAGQSHQLLEPDAKAVVLFFVGVECPVSNGYAPQITQLANTYAARGVKCYVVYSGTDVTAAVAAKHAKAYKISCPTLIDSTCDLAMAVGATMTLETAVLLPDGTIAYRGRFDDQYVTLGRKRFSPTTHDLQNVLDAILADGPVQPKFTQAVGCSIVMPEKKQP